MQRLLIHQICILTVLFIGYGFYYLTRKSVTFMLPHFNNSTTGALNLTKNDIGIIISSQNLAYAISKFCGGILTDLTSCRVLFGCGLFLSGLLNLGFKKEVKVYQLYYLSFLIGLAQGPAWPCIGKMLKAWLPKSQLATWWSVISASANVAGAIGPIIATAIAIRYHWSYGFIIPGCVCMSFGYLSIIVLRNRPSDVNLADFDDEEKSRENKQKLDDNNNNENDEIENEEFKDEEEEQKESRWTLIKSLLKYKFFCGMCLAYFMVQLLKTLFSDWSQMYFTIALKMSPYNASYFVSTFEIFGILGSILSGILTDSIYYFYKKKSAANNNAAEVLPIDIRMSLIRIYFVLMFAFFHLFNFYVTKTSAFWLLIVIAAVTGFLSYGTISLLGVMAMEFVPNKIAGTSHAIAALSANVGAIFAGLPFGALAKRYTFNGAFKIAEAILLIILTFLFLNRNAISKFTQANNNRVKEKIN